MFRSFNCVHSIRYVVCQGKSAADMRPQRFRRSCGAAGRGSQLIDRIWYSFGTKNQAKRWVRLAPRRAACPIARSSLVLEQAGQFAQPQFVASPAVQRATIDRLARLPDARCSDRLAIDLVMQTRVVPGKPAERHQPSGFGLPIADQGLVVQLGEAIWRKDTLPMRYQARILTIIECEVAAIAHKMLWRPELRKIDRQANIDRIAPAQDEAG